MFPTSVQTIQSDNTPALVKCVQERVWDIIHIIIIIKQFLLCNIVKSAFYIQILEEQLYEQKYLLSIVEPFTFRLNLNKGRYFILGLHQKV